MSRITLASVLWLSVVVLWTYVGSPDVMDVGLPVSDYEAVAITGAGCQDNGLGTRYLCNGSHTNNEYGETTYVTLKDGAYKHVETDCGCGGSFTIVNTGQNCTSSN